MPKLVLRASDPTLHFAEVTNVNDMAQSTEGAQRHSGLGPILAFQEQAPWCCLRPSLPRHTQGAPKCPENKQTVGKSGTDFIPFPFFFFFGLFSALDHDHPRPLAGDSPFCLGLRV